jgi:hypothetical protein
MRIHSLNFLEAFTDKGQETLSSSCDKIKITSLKYSFRVK